MTLSDHIDMALFESVDIRAGTILSVQELPDARHPAWVMEIDFGKTIGILRSSARITTLYSADDLVGRQIMAVVNLGNRQIGKIQSECLVLGFEDASNGIVLASVDRMVPNGRRLK